MKLLYKGEHKDKRQWYGLQLKGGDVFDTKVWKDREDAFTQKALLTGMFEQTDRPINLKKLVFGS